MCIRDSPWLSLIVLTDESDPAVRSKDFFTFVNSRWSQSAIAAEIEHLSSASELRRKLEDHNKDRRHNLELLSQRERDVLGFLAAGLESKEIAQQLGIGFSTVDKHKRRIYTKLGTGNCVETSNFVHSLLSKHLPDLAHLDPEAYANTIIDVINQQHEPAA